MQRHLFEQLDRLVPEKMSQQLPSEWDENSCRMAYIAAARSKKKEKLYHEMVDTFLWPSRSESVVGAWGDMLDFAEELGFSRFQDVWKVITSDFYGEESPSDANMVIGDEEGQRRDEVMLGTGEDSSEEDGWGRVIEKRDTRKMKAGEKRKRNLKKKEGVSPERIQPKRGEKTPKPVSDGDETEGGDGEDEEEEGMGDEEERSAAPKKRKIELAGGSGKKTVSFVEGLVGGLEGTDKDGLASSLSRMHFPTVGTTAGSFRSLSTVSAESETLSVALVSRNLIHLSFISHLSSASVQ